jgi:formate dehydrogenase iron-sulfur subunit
MGEKRMLIDTSKCIGCRGCQIACQQWHQLPAEDTSFTGSYQNPEDLSAANLTVAKFREVGNNGDLRWLFFVDRCRHCKDPWCKQACPLNAIRVKTNGMVFIKNKCDPTVCSTDEIKPCQVGCPFKTMDYSHVGIPRYRKNDGTLLADGKMNKCDFCYDRFRNATLKAAPYDGAFAKSNKPACQLACPTKAITSGKYDKMKRKANRRVRYLQANGYPNATKYPKGLPTHVIWVLLEDHSAYGIGAPSLPGA